MIVSDKHKFIFIAIYKNASTSIETALSREDCFIGGPSKIASPLSDLPRDINHPLLFSEPGAEKGNCVKKHVGATQLRQIMPARYDNYRKFAVVRNPWARVVSHYIYTMHYEKKPTPFSEWCETLNIKSNHHLSPCLSAITDESGEIIIDAFLYFEHLQAAFDQMCQLIKIEPRKLSRENAAPWRINDKVLGRAPHYTKFYDKRTKEIVREKYKDDIESLSYAFDGFDPPQAGGRSFGRLMCPTCKRPIMGFALV